MVVEKQNDNCFSFFFFWYNVFLTIGKCRFSDCVTHNLVISRIDRPSLVDFRFNSLNRNFSLYALYKSWKIHNKKYLRDYNLLLFFLNWGLCCLQLLFFILKKRDAKEQTMLLLSFFRLKKECVSSTLKRTFFRSKQYNLNSITFIMFNRVEQ